MDLGVGGKIVLSGGGSKGIGRATSELLAREGCRVVVAARGKAAVDETVAAIIAEGGEAVGVVADMSTKSGIRTAFEAARAAFGDPDIVVGNVYGPVHGGWQETAEEDFHSAYEAMVMSQVHLLREATPAMKAKRWGRIVLINSMASKEPHRDLPLLTANVTRVAAHALNKSVSNELASHGVTINTLGTGVFATDRLISYHKARAEKNNTTFDLSDPELVKDVPAGRPGDPKEMAAVAAFLCSVGAAYVTGQFIVVDGGATRALF